MELGKENILKNDMLPCVDVKGKREEKWSINMEEKSKILIFFNKGN
jgi:hypothetical protein